MQTKQVNKRVLTPRDEYGIAVYYVCGVPIKAIMEHFTVSRSAIHRVIQRLGVQSDRGKRS